MGAGERRVLWGHTLRNAAIPIATQAGLALPHVIEGSVIVETVFSWPGLGQLTVASVGRRDYPILLTITLLVGLGVLLSSWHCQVSAPHKAGLRKRVCQAGGCVRNQTRVGRNGRALLV